MRNLLNASFFRQKKYLYIFLVCVNMFALSLFFVFKPGPHIEPTRSLSSLYSERNSKQDLLRAKSHSALVVQIYTDIEIPEYDEDVLEFIAEVQLNRQKGPSSLNYHWLLDPGVEIVEGKVEDQLWAIEPGEIRTVRLKVKGFSKEHSRNVTLSASIEDAEMKIGNVASIHSRPEDSFEFVAPQVRYLASKKQTDKNPARGLASEQDNQIQKIRR